MVVRSLSQVPNSEAEFLVWATNFVNQIQSHPDLYFLDSARIENLSNGRTGFQAALDDATTARDAALAATRNKQTVRADFENNVRVAMKMVQANDQVTDAAREAAGVHPHKTTRTPVSVPSTCPVGFVMSTDRLEQTLSFSDSATPTRKAKPAGVSGCEVYLYVGNDTPQSPSQYTFHLLSTRTPQRITFTDENAGKTANYLLRWVNTKGQHGPWSQIISATIPAV